MLTKQAFELQDVQSEYDQSPLRDDERLVPLDMTRQTTEFEGEEIQVAGVFNSLSPAGARIISGALTGRQTFGSAYLKSVERLKRQKELEKTAVKNIDPKLQYTIENRAGGFEVVDGTTDKVLGRFGTVEEANKFLTKHKSSVTDLGPPESQPKSAQQKVDESVSGEKTIGEPDVGPVARMDADGEPQPLPPSIQSEMERNGSYKEWLTLGNDDYDAWMSGIRAGTVLEDGIIAGLRVKGRQAGMEVKVPNEGNIYSHIAASGEQIQKKLNALSPDEQKAISLDQTRALADVLGENPEKLKKRFLSGAFNLENGKPGQLAAQMVAAKDLLIFEIRKLDELADFVDGSRKLPEGVTTEQAQFQWLQQAELVANIQRQYKGAQTDIARAMSAFRIPARDDNVLIQRDYAKLISDVGGTEKVREIVDGYKKETDLPRRANQVRQLSKFQRFTDSVHEVWINSMLSGWRTHLKNTVGTWSSLVADIAEMSAVATAEAPKVLWGGQRSITFGDVQAKVFGQMMAMKEATSAAGRAFWLREDPIMGAEMSIISGSNPYRQDAISAENWNISNKAGARAIDLFGNLVTLGRAPTRMLMMGDAFNKIVAYRGTLWEEAYRAGRQKGKKGEALEDFIADFVIEPPDAAAQKGLEHAKYVTLQSDFDPGTILHDAQKVAGHRIMRLIIPFYKTPPHSI